MSCHSFPDRRAQFWRGAVLLALLAIQAGCTQQTESLGSTEAGTPQRVLALNPSITEVIFAIGAGDRLVARTQFSTYPPEVLELPSVGAGLTPDYEAIVRHAPDLVVVSRERSHELDKLRALAPVHVVPLLTFEEIAASTIELGQLLEHEPEAQQLAQQMRAALEIPTPTESPRLLLALGQPNESAPDVWFSKTNSLHGTVLRAAGFENAIPDEVQGSAHLPLEHLLSVDPDYVVVLLAQDEVSQATLEQHLAFWQKLETLEAVEQEKVFFVPGTQYFSTGPRLLELVEVLRALHSQDGSQP
ncbi:MAG: helical backbone metal receptor [Myxococcota bacterium]|nr:helical backbone metal receptor [Myxococcota bacterium]